MIPFDFKAKWLCDKYDDCGDYSDEFNCTLGRGAGCPADRFDCGQGQCISREFVCDGDRDCANGRDETRCDLKACDEGHFRCTEDTAGVECLPASARCDGHRHCPEGSDERSCPHSNDAICGKGQFKCKDNTCLEPNSVCDNTKDCQDGSDEVGCLFCAESKSGLSS